MRGIIIKICNSCETEKPKDQFYLVSKRDKPILYHICKTCCALKAQEYKEYYRDWELRKKYNITLQEYKEQVDLRKSCCDICGKEVKTLHVDHCHTSGDVRGLLCGSCNRGIGLLGESTEVLSNALVYLQNFERKICVS